MRLVGTKSKSTVRAPEKALCLSSLSVPTPTPFMSFAPIVPSPYDDDSQLLSAIAKLETVRLRNFWRARIALNNLSTRRPQAFPTERIRRHVLRYSATE
jgi:hypothetical protein